MPASISSKTSVSPPATAAIASAMRESSPPDAVSATGAERQPGVRADEEHGLVAAGCAGLALAQLADELAVAHADVVQLGRDGVRERGRGRARARRAARRKRVDMRASAAASASRGRLRPGRHRRRAPRARAAPRPARVEQLLVGLAAEAPLRLCDAVERRLELLEASRLGLERREERVQLRRGLAEAQLDVAQLVAGPLELGSEALERRDRTLGSADEPCGALALVGCQRLRRGRRRLGELDDVPKALALAREALLVARLETLGVLGERAQLGEPRLGGRGVRASARRGGAGPRGARATRRARRARRRSCSSPQKRSSTSSWYAGRARRRCSNCPDIAITRSTAAATSSRAAARPQAYARVRPSCGDAARDEQRVLVLRLQLGELVELPSGSSSSAST